jgi:hypothetical protein
MQKRFYTKDDSGFESLGSASVTKTTSKSRLVLIFLFLIIGAGLLFVGVKLLGMQSESKKMAVVTPTPTVMPTDTPTPVLTVTPSASPALTGKPTLTPTGKITPTVTQSLTLSVLNGSGTPGAAGDMASSLKKLGYTIASTGNADAFTYTGITVKIKKSKSDMLAQLKKDVGTVSPVGSTSATLSESTAVDAQVIVGK